jgi:hypothetical protein
MLRVLRDKFHRTPEWLTEAEQQLRVVARLVEPTESLHVIEADPTDDRILECAVAAVAEVIVSGDSHILSLGSFRGIPILRVAEFLSRVQTNTSGDPMSIAGVVAVGDYTASSKCVSASPLDPDATCTVTVTFTPTAAGPRQGALQITELDETFRFRLTGTGLSVPRRQP